MKTRHEQAKEEVESLVSEFESSAREFESSARAFLSLNLSLSFPFYRKKKLRWTKPGLYVCFFVQLELISFCQVLSNVTRSNILKQILKLNKKWQL